MAARSYPALSPDYRFSFPPYPTGWFCVAYSHEIEAGQAKPLKYFGQDLVIFRTESGEAKLLDAFCPHLGAHLGHGGVVEGEDIKCPFHAWKFNGEGKCTDVPYMKNVFPKKADIPKWTTTERNGMIMAWHHTECEAPAWEIPQLSECDSDEWTDFKYREWTIKTRNQEMAENAVDTAHFHYLHGTQNLPEAELEQKGHQLNVNSNTLTNSPMGPVEGAIQVEMHGFGFTTTRFVGIVETLLVNSVTSIDNDYVHCRFAFMVKKMGGRSVTEGIGAAYIREIERQLEQDIPIWENKRHIKPPILCDGDGPIGKYRKWCKQLYSDPNAQP
jgi:nitrite reductase/ring-hydroxylating ferredoxin subunit